MATEEKVNLIWHQAPKDRDKSKNAGQRAPLPPPVSVTGWFEYGSQLDSTVVFPKFVWRQTFQNGTTLISRVPNYIQLLTVVRVIEPRELDRSFYPFARLDRTFCITTHDGDQYVFETANREDRGIFVNKLKVLVARLASSVIANDEAMLREFFPGGESFADYDDEMSTDCSQSEEKIISPSSAIA